MTLNDKNIFMSNSFVFCVLQCTCNFIYIIRWHWTNYFFHWYYTQLIAETIKLFNDFVEHMYGPKSDNLKIVCTYIQTSYGVL